MSRNEKLLQKLRVVESRAEITPVQKLEDESLDLFVKLEHYNFMGSVKDRAALAIMKHALETGEIGSRTMVIEASSGNFALSVSALCRFLGLRFAAVIDPGINRVYERLIQYFSHLVIKVDKKDKNGGYLLTKLDAVHAYCEEHSDVYWTNQYENPRNFAAHYHGTAVEICEQFQHLDYIFIAVASGGTISGISRRLKEHFCNIKVIAVDAEGSVIFGTPPKPRHIPGMGSGMVPPLVARAVIDDVVHVSEPHTIQGCHELFSRHGMFLGGSSGTAYQAIQTYFKNKKLAVKPTVLFLSPDRGVGYADNIYNEEWLKWFAAEHQSVPDLV